jgi:hypothetical protein
VKRLIKEEEMSYRFYPERVEPIGNKAGVADTDMIVPVTGYDGMRVTIPLLSIVTGATAQVLTVMQVKELDTMTAIDSVAKEVTLETIETDLTGRYAAMETVDGDWFISKVTASAAKVHTIEDAFPADGLKLTGRFFLFAATDDELNQKASLEASKETILTQPAPGRFVGRDFCFPVILHMTNDTNALTLQGGMAVYINR